MPNGTAGMTPLPCSLGNGELDNPGRFKKYRNRPGRAALCRGGAARTIPYRPHGFGPDGAGFS